MTNIKRLFSDLSKQDIDLISQYGNANHYPRNSILINKGETSNSFYIIKTGRVKVYISDGLGSSIIFGFLGPGEYFGELAFIDEEPRSASVSVVQDSILIHVSHARFENCLTENPALAVKFVRLMTKRIRKLTETLSNCALMPVYQRVRIKLLEMAVKKEGGYIITQRITHQDVADLVGCGREMVSRVMSRLQNGGYIHIEKKKITILKDLPISLH